MRDLIIEDPIAGKRVFTFDSHNLAFLAWAQVAADDKTRPRLLTLDYHTDTMVAFRREAGARLIAAGGQGNWLQTSQELVAKIDLADPASLEWAVLHLRHDEHIDAAIRAGVLELAFVICHEYNGCIRSNEQQELDAAPRAIVVDGVHIQVPGRERAPPPYTWSLPADKMVVLPRGENYSWTKAEVGDGREERDAALESEFLQERLDFIDSICVSAGVPKLFDAPFILDIDLDYLNTRRAANPRDSVVFRGLVQRASAITIARERECVVAQQLPGEDLGSDWLEAQVKELIKSSGK